MNETEASHLADEWIQAWNSHDLDRILTHYEDDIELTSPVAVRLLGDAEGVVRGKPALRAYFARALERYPDLRFEMLGVFRGLRSVVLHYRNQNGVGVAEFMEVGGAGKVCRVVAHYSGL